MDVRWTNPKDQSKEGGWDLPAAVIVPNAGSRLLLHHLLHAGEFTLLRGNTVHDGRKAPEAAWGRGINACPSWAQKTHRHSSPGRQKRQRGALLQASEATRQHRVPARKKRPSPRARPCCGPEPSPPGASSQPPPGVFPSAAQPAPLLFLTFLGSDREPPGMIRNTWPLGAAGAQEIRTLELGKNQGSRLENKHRFRGWGVPLWGCLPGFLGPGRVRISCLWRAPRVQGSLGVH